jgi:hypothetical protein
MTSTFVDANSSAGRCQKSPPFITRFAEDPEAALEVSSEMTADGTAIQISLSESLRPAGYSA